MQHKKEKINLQMIKSINRPVNIVDGSIQNFECRIKVGASPSGDDCKEAIVRNWPPWFITQTTADCSMKSSPHTQKSDSIIELFSAA